MRKQNSDSDSSSSDNNSEGKQIFICEIDSMKFYNEKDYLEHYDEEHPDDYPFYCGPCNQGFNSVEAILSHKNNSLKHRNRTTTYFFNFNCRICNRKSELKML